MGGPWGPHGLSLKKPCESFFWVFFQSSSVNGKRERNGQRKPSENVPNNGKTENVGPLVTIPYCLAENTPNNHHRRRGTMPSLPVSPADYGYIGDGDRITILVVHIKPYGVIFACVADCKGQTPNMVTIFAELIKLCGRVRFLYRSDKSAPL